MEAKQNEWFYSSNSRQGSGADSQQPVLLISDDDIEYQ